MLQRGSKTNKKKFESFPLHVKTGDTVIVISGKYKGQTGIIRKVFNDRGRVVVEGINKIKKSVRPNPMAGVKGGITEMDGPIAASKVMLYCTESSKPTRIKHDFLADGRKTRVSKHTGAHFDA